MAAPDEVDRFIEENGIDKLASDQLLQEDPDVQRVVIDKGSVKDTRNPSAVLMQRIRAARADLARLARGDHEQVNVSKDAIEQFLLNNKIDKRAATFFLTEDAQVQLLVMERGNFDDCRNPSSVLMSRLKKVKDSLRERESRIGEAPSSILSSHRDNSAERDIEVFIESNGIDQHAEAALRSQDPAVIQMVLERGAMTNCTNPSSALMGRIKEVTWLVKSCPPQHLKIHEGLSHQVEQFLSENNIDKRGCSELRLAVPEVQRLVMSRGGMGNAKNPSAAVLGRMRSAKEQLQKRSLSSILMQDCNKDHLDPRPPPGPPPGLSLSVLPEPVNKQSIVPIPAHPLIVPGMPDLPSEFKVSPEQLLVEDSTLVCVVCTQVLHKPVVTRCSHLFCYDCLERWVEAKSTINPVKSMHVNSTFRGTCPTCHEELYETDVTCLNDESTGVHGLLWRLYQDQMIRCAYHYRTGGGSCHWEGKFKDYSQHVLLECTCRKQALMTFSATYRL